MPQVTIQSAIAVPGRVALGDPVTIHIKAQNRASAVTVAVRTTVNYPNNCSSVYHWGNVPIPGGNLLFQGTKDVSFDWTVPSSLSGIYTVDAEIVTNHTSETDRSSCSGTKRVNIASFQVVTNTAPSAAKVSPSSYYVDIDEGDRQTFTVEGTDAESNLNTWRWLVGGTQERLQSVTPTAESEDSFS